jgi:PilZ domain
MPHNVSTPSRRLAARVEAAGEIWAYWHCGGRDDISRIRDIGLGGVFLETSVAKELGSLASLHLLVSEGQIRADAIVRHTSPGRGLGLKFTALPDQDRPHLAALLRRLRAAASPG